MERIWMRLLRYLAVALVLLICGRAGAVYDPTAGRFLSPDPLGHSASWGLYDFCNGDPVNHFDADGRMWKSPLAGYESGMADLRYANSASGQFMQAYHQTQAQMQQMRTFSYDEPSGSGLSSLLNMTPVVGTFKMWTEMNTGKDWVTGQWHHQSDTSLFLGAVGNALGTASMFSGMARQGAYNAASRSSLASSYADWQTRSTVWASKLPQSTWAGASASLHPGALAADAANVTKASILWALRQSGTPQALATSKLITRGYVNPIITPTDTAGLGAAGRASWSPFRNVYIALDKVQNARSAAGIAAHESRHILDKLTPNTYMRFHELRAYQWQRGAGFLNKSDNEIIDLINSSPLYQNVPGTLSPVP